MVNKKYKGSFFKHFMIIFDPRQTGKVWHKLIDVLFIAVVASVCGFNEWEEIEVWAKKKEEWLRKYLELPNGIPSYSTIRRVFDFIDPKQFEKCFATWMKEVTEISKGTIVAIDGKTMCGTADKAADKKGIHIVNAWCSANKMILGQVKTDDKSNEITAVPELLDMLFIKGCIVTVDAMNTQKDTVKKIVKENKADYVVVLKENHPILYGEVQEYFLDEEKNGFKNEKIESYRTFEKGHGRIEERIYYYSTDIKWIDAKEEWEKMNGIGMVIRRTEEKGNKTEERTFHFGSVNSVIEYAKAVRQHWGIESMHWSLDVTFSEDACKTRKGKAPENLAMLKRLSLNMVRKDEARYPKKSLKIRKVHSLLDEEYLDYILKINFG
jgi:predicted transposase YbfD/YdcC